MRAARRALPLLAAALALVAAWPSLPGGFVYDDWPYVAENRDLAGGWDRVPRLFRSAFPSQAPERGLYRPLTALTYRLDRVLGPPDPVRSRAANFALAFLLVLAAHAVMRRAAPEGAALAGAILFAVHPSHIEAVAWVTGRSELLAAGLACAAFVCAVDAMRTGGAGRSLAAGSLLLVGALGKESALVALPLAASWAAMQRDRPPARRLVPPLIAMAVGAAVAWVARLSVLGTWGPSEGRVGAASLVERLPLVIAALGEHLRLLVWPWPLSIERMPSAPAGWSDPSVVTGLLTIAGWLAIITAVRRSPGLRFLALWPVVALLPVMHLVPIGETVAERFLVIPSVGACGLLGTALVTRGPAGAARRAALVLVAAAGLAGSRAYASTWRSEEAVWRHALEQTPRSGKAWAGLGDAIAREGRPHEAEPCFRRALGSDPGLTVARLALAQALDAQGRPDAALEETRTAVRSDPDHPVALGNLGARLARAGRAEEGLPFLLRAVAVAPGYAPALRNAALATAQTGRPEEALELWERARAADPDLPPWESIWRVPPSGGE